MLNDLDSAAFKYSDNSAKKKFKDYIESFVVLLELDKFEKQQHIVEGFLYDVLSMHRYELTQLFQRKILSEDQQRICSEIDRYEHLKKDIVYTFVGKDY